MDNVESRTEQKSMVETNNVDCPRIKKPVTLHIQKLSLGDMERPTLRVIHVECEQFERHSLKCKQDVPPDVKDLLLLLKLADNHYLGGLVANLVELLGYPYCRYRLDEIKRRLIERAIDRPDDKNVLLL